MAIQQGWVITVDRPLTIHIPDVRETDARQMVRRYLAGEIPQGEDWTVTEQAPFVAVATLILSPNEVAS